MYRRTISNRWNQDAIIVQPGGVGFKLSRSGDLDCGFIVVESQRDYYEKAGFHDCLGFSKQSCLHSAHNKN